MPENANPEAGADGNQQPQNPEEQIASLLNEGGEFADDPQGESDKSQDDNNPDDEDPEGDDPDADDAEGEDPEGDGEDDDEPGAGDDEELDKFESLDELAEAAGMTPDDIKALVTSKIKVQGEEREVTLAELEQGHMFESDYRQKTSSLAEERRTFEGEREQAKQILETSLQQSTQLVQAIESDLMGELNSVDWNSLKVEDPTEYNLRRGELADRQQRLEQFKQHLANQWQEYQNGQQQEAEKAQEEYSNQQKENLTRLIPEWLDTNKAKSGREEIDNYLKTAFEGDLALSEEDIASVADARLIALVQKAMLYDQGQKKVKTVKKKVRNLPKVVKPGAKKGKGELSAEKRTKQQKRLQKTGSVDDAAALILNTLG